MSSPTGLLDAARTGDADAFERLVQPLRREIHLHCYRMLGSLHDAEDLAQETLLRAWRRIGMYAGRASFRSWLYKIATNACLDALRRRARRVLPDALYRPADPRHPVAPDVPEVSWLEPYPDAFLDEVNNPEARYLAREGVALGFIAALQHLPPRQRAVLILREVLEWEVSEIADFLGGSVASVNSALQRARNKLKTLAVDDQSSRIAPEIVDRYLRAWDAGDEHALAALLREDAVLTMPPSPSWYRGRDDVAAFFGQVAFGQYRGRLRLVPLDVNRQPGFAIYRWEPAPGVHEAMAIKVLTLDRSRITRITGFVDLDLFRLFGLPARLDSRLRPP